MFGIDWVLELAEIGVVGCCDIDKFGEMPEGLLRFFSLPNCQSYWLDM